MNMVSKLSCVVASLLFVLPSQSQDLSIKVFDLPEGSRPHDVAPAPDGLVWYTAQRKGALGILDPQNGEITHVPLGEGSAPHGVIQGPAGSAWITDGGLNAILRYDPGTGEIDKYPLPEGELGANLNTATFDGDDVLWFTGQAGVIGRFDPMMNDMMVMDAPKGRGPYGIATAFNGEVYFASLAGSYIAHIDRDMDAIEVIDIPREGQGARRVWADGEGDIWVSEWNSGYLSRYRPRSQEWKSYKLPGENPKPYAVYVDERDIVWVSDFSANAVLSFDSKVEKFTGSYSGSADGANVRQILGRPGEIWLPESGTDRLMVIYTKVTD